MTDPHAAAMTAVRAKYAEQISAAVEIAAKEWQQKQIDSGHRLGINARDFISTHRCVYCFGFTASRDAARIYWDSYTAVCAR